MALVLLDVVAVSTMTILRVFFLFFLPKADQVDACFFKACHFSNCCFSSRVRFCAASLPNRLNLISIVRTLAKLFCMVGNIVFLIFIAIKLFFKDTLLKLFPSSIGHVQY